MKLDQNEFQKAKHELDLSIASVSALAGLAKKRSLECCAAASDLDECEAEEYLNVRDDLGEIASLLRQAESAMEMARSKAGRISGAGLARSGGT